MNHTIFIQILILFIFIGTLSLACFLRQDKRALVMIPPTMMILVICLVAYMIWQSGGFTNFSEMAAAITLTSQPP